ncbi:MAG TPA: (Fe-S)-binding protein [bacterium]|nr:(Fe-S)-binding protein [bacterium]
MEPTADTETRTIDLLGPYNPDACEQCGRCLMECPVMGLPEREAKKEIRELAAGRAGKHVLRRCETCFACTVACPNGANPVSLFQQRFFGHHNKKPLQAWASYFQPHEHNNFRTYVIERLPEDEKAILEKWNDLSPCEEFAYPGCNMCTIPSLTGASFMRDLNIRGALEWCCGEMYFRTGMFDQLRGCAERMNALLDRLGAKKMMVLCTAGFNIISNVLPKYGLDTDVEITSYLPWLWEKLDSGGIEIKKPLNMSVTIQESCHSKLIGAEYTDLPRKILEKIGVRVKEMDHCRENAYCCGIGGGFPAKQNYNPLALGFAMLRAVREAEKTRADATATYCAGCLQMMSSGSTVYPGAKPVYHIIELVQMAAGEKPARRAPARGRQMLAGTMINQAPKLLSTGKTPMPDVSVEI